MSSILQDNLHLWKITKMSIQHQWWPEAFLLAQRSDLRHSCSGLPPSEWHIPDITSQYTSNRYSYHLHTAKLLLHMNQVWNKICFGTYDMFSCFGNHSNAFACIASMCRIIKHRLRLRKPLASFCSRGSLLLTLQLLRIKKNWWGFEMMDV